MKRSWLIAAAAATTLFAATAAHASRVNWSVNVDLPPIGAVVSSGYGQGYGHDYRQDYGRGYGHDYDYGRGYGHGYGHGYGGYAPRPVYRSHVYPIYQPAPVYAPVPIYVVPRPAWRHHDVAPPWAQDRHRHPGHRRFQDHHRGHGGGGWVSYYR